MQDNYTTKGKHFKTAPKFSILFLFHFCKKLNLFFYLWYDYDYTKIKQKGQYDYEKFFLSSVVLLSLVTSLPVNSPVSAQESISP